MIAKRGWLLAAALVLCAVTVAFQMTISRGSAFPADPLELRQRYATEESRFVELKGIEIHYQDRGTGPVMLLLHGSFGSLFTWEDVVGDLATDFRVITVDAPGVGLSGRIPDDAKRLGVRPEDVLDALLDSLDVAQALVAGVSSGGVDGYRLAATRPERVAGLVLSNVPPGPVDNEALPRSPRLQRWTRISALLGGHFPQRYWRAFLDWTFHSPERVDPRMVRLHYDLNRREPDPNMPLRPWARSMEEVTPFLEAVTARTRLLWADSSPVLPLSVAQTLLASLPNAQVDIRTLESVGHYPHMEAPLAFAAELRAFHHELSTGATAMPGAAQ